MFRMNDNPNSPARHIRLAGARGRRRDDATFIAIAALLAVLFVMQAGWMVVQQVHP